MPKTYMLADAEKKIDRLQAQLAIAVKALDEIYIDLDTGNISIIDKALADIEKTK